MKGIKNPDKASATAGRINRVLDFRLQRTMKRETLLLLAADFYANELRAQRDFLPVNDRRQTGSLAKTYDQ